MRRFLFYPFFLIRKLAGWLGLGRYGTLREIYRRFKTPFKRRQTTVDGHRIFLDSEDSLDLSLNPAYEDFERKILKSLIKEGDSVLDIGANIGFYTLLFARWVGPMGRVIAFEPDPDNFELLKRNVAANGYANVVMHRKAVSNRAGLTDLYLSASNKADHRLYDSGDGRPSVEVETVRLDDFLTCPEPIHFIKMDIQGSELDALAGMRDLLKANPQVKVFLEFWPAGLARCGTDPEDLLRLLQEMNFRIREIAGDSESSATIDKLEQLLQKYPFEAETHTNLLCERNLDLQRA